LLHVAPIKFREIKRIAVRIFETGELPRLPFVADG
jgi:hypothetical protein